MRKILILGAGGFGREVWNYLSQSPKCGVEWQIGGFLDDNVNALDEFDYPQKIVARTADYQAKPGELIVCALGSPEVKEKVCTSLLDRGAVFKTFVHHTALVGKKACLGKGCFLAPHSIITSDACLGDFVTINCFSGCGHDVVIGDFTTLSSYCDLTGGVQLGKKVFLGSHVTVVPGRKVGDSAYIGAGSAVVTHVKSGQKVLGVPAKTFM
jgi:sugar O-acyltransferase (sialic acid O-acetyltransferase NeuD family)